MHWPKYRCRVWATCLAIGTLAFLVEWTSVETAYAQSGGELVRPAPGNSRSFSPFKAFKRLFENGGVKRRKTVRRTTGGSTRSAKVARSFAEKPKDPDAGIILVVGDRMARGLADGLKFTLAEKPMVRVDFLTEDKAGLAGVDGPDWNAQVLARIRGADVKAVVVMMGQRDLGRVLPGDPVVEFLTEGWLEAYKKKAMSLARTIREERKPVIWVGLPPTSETLKNSDFGSFNAIFQSVVAETRSRYVDIWDIFLSEDGSYSTFGPDVDGKNARLRTKDKTGFTWAGYRKVAFFVERELSRVLGGYGGLAFEGVLDDPNFIVLTGRTTSSEVDLLGGDSDEPAVDEGSPAYRFLVRGDDLPPVAGRVDDPRLRRAGGS